MFKENIFPVGINFFVDNYEKAIRKSVIVEDTSDLSSSGTERFRKRKKNSKYEETGDSSSGESSDHNQSSYKAGKSGITFPKFPKPSPKVIGINLLLVVIYLLYSTFGLFLDNQTYEHQPFHK